MDHKTARLDLKREPDQDGVFEGYASVFDIVDGGLDVVARGAFAKSLASGRKVKMLWQHDQAQPIGVWDEIREDDTGLFVRGRLLKDVAKGAEAMALLRAGAIDSMSIGYKTIKAATGAGSTRRLTEVELFEVSIVTFPMLDAAKVTALKSDATIRDWETYLRDVGGLSQKQAKALLADGYRGIAGQRDAGADDTQDGAKSLLLEIRQLQENISCLTK
jgi:HK97 family phage prohead protease